MNATRTTAMSALAALLASASFAAKTTLPSSQWSLTTGETSSTFADVAQFTGASPQLGSLTTSSGTARASVFSPDVPIMPGTEYLSLGFQELSSVGGAEIAAAGTIDFELTTGALFALRAELRGVTDPGDLDYLLELDDQQWTFADAHLEGRQYVIDAVGVLAPGEHSFSWRYANWGGNEGRGSVVLTMKVPEPGSWLLGVLLIAGFGWLRL